MNGTRPFAAIVCAALALGAGCRVERSPAASPFSQRRALADGPGGEASDPKPSVVAPATGGGGGSGAGSAATGAGSAAADASADAGGSADGTDAGAAQATAGAGGSADGSADPGAAGSAGDPPATDAAAGGGGDRCDPDVLLCDPVTNRGCPNGMQCAVDALSDVLAGYCIFSTPMPDGCFNSGVTESCPPTETCFELACRKLCFCDDDCKGGQCCVDPVGTLGFKVCGEC